ncbi:MAG: Holliday junction resolvase RuvX [bacterium]|nr:Holliday junction resolvase RuvX [bacterium]
MRVMALDLGEKTIGIAVSDELKMTAQGIKTMRRRGIKTDLAELGDLIHEFDVERLVVGMPRNMNGSYGPAAEKTQEFVAKLAVLNLPVELVDERLTTRIAEQALIEGNVRRKKRRKVIDQVAATLILQDYLGRQGRGAGEED